MKKANFTPFTMLRKWLILSVLCIMTGAAASAQCALACDDLIQVSLDEDCEVAITPTMILEGNGCPNGNLVVEAKINYVWVPAIVTSAQINQTIQVRVRDLTSGNMCWGYIHVEDKLAPIVTCANITLSCAITDYSPEFLLNDLNITQAYPLVNENCGPFTLTHIDTWFDLPCNGTINGLTDVSAYVTRKWTATDPSGNFSTCTQFIYFFRRHVQNIVFPPNITISCGNPVTTPNVTGAPYILDFGIQFPLYPNNAFCELNIAYTDQVLPVCDGTYKILRTWTAYDWCLPTTPTPPSTNPLIYQQLIKILDDQGPVLDCPDNLTVSTDPTGCCVQYNLPDVIITDNCSRIASIQAHIFVRDLNNVLIDEHLVGGVLRTYPGNNLWIPDTLGDYGITPCLPVGRHRVDYIATDDCGNSSTCSFLLTVEDGTPPSPSCDQVTKVSLGATGMALISASVLDDGSYDNCSPVYFKARRMNSNSCQSSSSFHDQVKFCCSDVGDSIRVVLRVYDVPVPTGDVSTTFQDEHANDCMVWVTVDDKIPPTCQAPVNMTVSCTNFDPTLWAYGQPITSDNCCVQPVVATANYSLFDTVCNRGTITRTFRVSDCNGQSTQCTQRVVVNYNQDYYLKFPADQIVTVCDGTGNFGEPSFYGKDCELLGVSFADEIFTVVPDACYKIERTWTVINWCTYNPNTGCVYVPNPNPNPTVNSPQNLPGVTISAPGNTVAGWAPTVVKIDPGDTGPVLLPSATNNQGQTNYSVFYTGGNYTTRSITGAPANFAVPAVGLVNCYRYKQIVKVIDTKAPVIANCPASPVTFCDVTLNDPFLWNEAYYYDPITGSHDLCEGPTDLTITATDACSLQNIDFRYLLFLDLNQDGVMETVINSNSLPGYNTVFFGNALNQNYTGGVPYNFDERLVPFNQKYGFALQTTVSGVNKTARVAWNTQANQSQYVVPELPYGTHKIKWYVSDGCGNESTCEYNFIVRDCKAPNIVCINGLATNVMPTTLWAIDFLQYAQDNCTPANLLKFGIRRSGTGTGFPVNPDGTPQTSITFTCADLGIQNVELWAIDLAGNIDFCETYIVIQDNQGNCPGGPIVDGTIAGALKTETGIGVEEASVELVGNPPAGLPPVVLSKLTTNTGNYMFQNVLPMTSSYTVVPTKDDNYLNGVSTFDLVLISRHILGLEPLNSPYKMIAADANKSGSITTSDIVELRKLILGIYQELPNNASWRFVDKSFAFPNPNNPFQTVFPEDRSLANLEHHMLTEDFVAVKVGDINNNVLANAQQAPEDRSAGMLLFDVADQAVQAGEEVLVNFQAAEKTAGYQFTLDFPGLDLQEVLPGANMTQQNFGVFSNRQLLTASVDGHAGEFALRFRATRSGQLSSLLHVSSQVTKAEAYISDPAFAEATAVKDIGLRFNGTKGAIIANSRFELLQNTPNPMQELTNIGFYLPEASVATLTISTVDGRVLKVIKGDYKQGLNTLQIARPDLETGVLFYQLDTPTHSAARKMVVVK